MCQSPARGRRRLCRRPALVRLIAPARHLPLPPAPPIPSSSCGEGRGGEAEAGEGRPLPPTSLHTGVRAAGGSGNGGVRPRAAEGGRGSPGWRRRAGRSFAQARPNFDQLVEAGAGSRGAARSPGRAETAACSRVPAPTITSGGKRTSSG